MKILLEQDGWRLCWDFGDEAFLLFNLHTDQWDTSYWKLMGRTHSGDLFGKPMVALVDRLKMLEAAQEFMSKAHIECFGYDEGEELREALSPVVDALTTNPNGKWMEDD